MNTTYRYHSEYERGYDAAQRALDRSTIGASDALMIMRAAEYRYRNEENIPMAEWSKGYGDAFQEFLEDKAS